MGSNFIPINLIIDISTDWMAVKARDCQTCSGKTYDTSSSNRFIRNTQTTLDRVYDLNIHYKGYEAQDNVCLAELADCVDPFTFFIISEQDSLDGGISGILGMALGAQTYNPSGQP